MYVGACTSASLSTSLLEWQQKTQPARAPADAQWTDTRNCHMCTLRKSP